MGLWFSYKGLRSALVSLIFCSIKLITYKNYQNSKIIRTNIKLELHLLFITYKHNTSNSTMNKCKSVPYLAQKPNSISLPLWMVLEMQLMELRNTLWGFVLRISLHLFGTFGIVQINEIYFVVYSVYRAMLY